MADDVKAILVIVSRGHNTFPFGEVDNWMMNSSTTPKFDETRYFLRSKLCQSKHKPFANVIGFPNKPGTPNSSNCAEVFAMTVVLAKVRTNWTVLDRSQLLKCNISTICLFCTIFKWCSYRCLLRDWRMKFHWSRIVRSYVLQLNVDIVDRIRLVELP